MSLRVRLMSIVKSRLHVSHEIVKIMVQSTYTESSLLVQFGSVITEQHPFYVVSGESLLRYFALKGLP